MLQTINNTASAAQTPWLTTGALLRQAQGEEYPPRIGINPPCQWGFSFRRGNKGRSEATGRWTSAIICTTNDTGKLSFG